MDDAVAIPKSALIVLIGPAGSGKSTFAKRNFPAGAIISSDSLRRERHDPPRKGRRNDVFEEMLQAVEGRLQAGKLTVVDATNTDWMRRSELINQARRYGRATIAIAFALPVEVSLAQNASRPEAVAPHLVRRQSAAVEHDLDRLDLEGFSPVIVLRSNDEAQHLRLQIDEGPVARASC